MVEDHPTVLDGALGSFTERTSSASNFIFSFHRSPSCRRVWSMRRSGRETKDPLFAPVATCLQALYRSNKNAYSSSSRVFGSTSLPKTRDEEGLWRPPLVRLNSLLAEPGFLKKPNNLIFFDTRCSPLRSSLRVASSVHKQQHFCSFSPFDSRLSDFQC